jgi:prolyl oligopeptidase PreP (S9A serine peptidase family)
MMREPLLFDSISIHNPITDLTTYLFDTYQSTPALKTKLIEEYGDINNKDIYNILKLMSPYEIPFASGYRYSTDLLLTYDRDNHISEAHSKKFIAKMREVNSKGDFMFLRPVNSLSGTHTEQKIINYSFLALSLLFRIRREDYLFQKSEDIEKQMKQFKLDLELSKYDIR